MSQPEFDRFASTYRQMHEENISASGESPEYFAAYKMRDFADIVKTLGISATGRFLDFGSGVGASVRSFRARLPDARLVCADVSLQSLGESQASNGSGPEYLHIEGARLPLDDASVDGAFACCVFHHIPPDEHVARLGDIRRTLKPGAPLMVYEHNPYNPLTVKAVNTCPFDANAILIRAGNMRRLCEEAGFASVRIRYRVFFPAGLGFMRPLENYLGWMPIGAQYFVCATT